MAESDIITTNSPPPLSESDNSTPMPTIDMNQHRESEEEMEMKKPEGGISLRIWPPSQKTRDAVVNRLIETLSTDSILSNRYGTLQSEEASTVAKSIEEEAYAVASASDVGEDDGINILQFYTKEISKRMLDSVKARTIASPTKTVANGTELTAADESNAESTDSTRDEDAPVESVKLET